jgi:predicted transcriptional regulator
MALTIQLPPETERWLNEKAAEQGQDAAALAAEIVAQALQWEQQDSAEAVAGVQRGLDDFAQGRHRPFGEFAEEQRRKHGLPRA